MAKDIAEELSTATGVHHRRHAQHETLSQDEASNNASRISKSAAGSRRSARKEKGGSGAAEHGKLIKYGSLVLLIVQMVGLVLLMRYSRTASSGEDLYLSSTAVATMELTKFIICLAVVGFQCGSLEGLVKQLQQHILYSPGELLKLSVPSFLYMVQNNLLYLALSNLDAATYQVCYQLKILTTAVFSALLLNRKFSRTKWMAICVLTIGVAIVQSSGSGDSTQSNEHDDEGGDDDETLQASGSSQQRLVGLIAVLCAACTSGFSGVYFERILKGSSTTLWIRNIQMGLPSVILAFLGVYTKDHQAVSERGFFHGYNSLVWLVVIVQAAGGLIVAVVVRYADNVLKTFAASFSIIVSCVVSAILFDFRPNAQFIVGTVLVVFATAMYSRPEGGLAKRRRRRRRQILPTTTSIADARRSRHRSYVA